VEHSYSSILYLNLALDGGRAHYTPAALLQDRVLVSGVQETGWASLGPCEQSHPTWDMGSRIEKNFWNYVGDEE
jgi:hypothetical protein